MKLIDKDAIIAEIERRRRDWRYGSSIEAKFKREECDDILSFIDSLEVKDENNLENLFQALPEKIADEKSHQVYELSIYHYDGQCVVDYVGEIDHDSLHSFSGNTLYEAIEKAWNWLRENAKGG